VNHLIRIRARRQKRTTANKPRFSWNRAIPQLMYLSAISRLFSNSCAKSRKNRDGDGRENKQRWGAGDLHEGSTESLLPGI
jgi:hypothetical protein